MSDKVEKITSGTPREFSAIKGQGKASKGPSGKDYGEQPAIAKVKIPSGNCGGKSEE